MGESKRRRALDPQYGQQRKLPEVVNLRALTKEYTEAEVDQILSEESDAAETANFLLGAFTGVPVVRAGEGSFRKATQQEIRDLKRAGKIPSWVKEDPQL